MLFREQANLTSDKKASQEQLQQSLISAGEQNEADNQRIRMDKYQADINASSSLRDKPKPPPAQTMPLMLPDTVYQKPSKPIDKPLPKRGVNTVHDTGTRDFLLGIASSAATAWLSP